MNLKSDMHVRRARDMWCNTAFEMLLDGRKNYNNYHTLTELGPIPYQRHSAKRIPFPHTI